MRYFGILLNLLAMNILFLCLFKAGIIIRAPHLLGSQEPVIYLLGPCFYFFARAVADAWKPMPIHSLHFVPALITFAAYVPLYALSVEEKIKIIESWNWETGDFGWRIHFIWVGVLMLVGYYLVSLRTLYRGGMDARNSFILLATGTPTISLLFWGQWLPNLELTEIGFLFLEAHLLTFYLLADRDRNWLNLRQAKTSLPTDSETSSRRGETKKSDNRLRILDTTAVLRHLDQLMVKEKCFVDEDLDIGRLAAMLGIKRHQLSELLNHVIGKDF